MRTKIDQLISQNEKLKLDVESLDNQIGLLVRNLISAKVFLHFNFLNKNYF